MRFAMASAAMSAGREYPLIEFFGGTHITIGPIAVTDQIAESLFFPRSIPRLDEL